MLGRPLPFYLNSRKKALYVIEIRQTYSAFFILVTFLGFILSTTWLSHYSTSTTFTLLKASFWIAVILTIIGFRREKSTLAVMLFDLCTLA